jgi:alkylhydroperoxidase/carboxymuconolactone decarboxylase family protein YurZ
MANNMTASVEVDTIRARVEHIYGSFSPGWALLLKEDPTFAGAFAGYLNAAYQVGELQPKIRELLLLAHDATVTVLNEDGVRLRVRRALDFGATKRQILDVLELVALISIHSLTTGLPLIAGPEHADLPRPARVASRYWDDFENQFPGFHSHLAAAAPELFDAYRDLGDAFSRGPDGLEPKWRELAVVVADLSTSHLFRDGAAFHIATALRYGATPTEVVAAIALAVPCATRTLEIGLAALADYDRA